MTTALVQRRTARARNLRQPMPTAELLLWRAVRNRQLGGFKIRRQHLLDRFFADFACVEARLVIELDGVSHERREAQDADRTAIIERCGWRVIRVANAEIGHELPAVLKRLLAELSLSRT